MWLCHRGGGGSSLTVVDLSDLPTTFFSPVPLAGLFHAALHATRPCKTLHRLPASEPSFEDVFGRSYSDPQGDWYLMAVSTKLLPLLPARTIGIEYPQLRQPTAIAQVSTAATPDQPIDDP
jgi:hypothetical protein